MILHTDASKLDIKQLSYTSMINPEGAKDYLELKHLSYQSPSEAKPSLLDMSYKRIKIEVRFQHNNECDNVNNFCQPTRCRRSLKSPARTTVKNRATSICMSQFRVQTGKT